MCCTTCLSPACPHLCVVLGLHGALDPQQLLHGVLIAVGHFKVRPARPELLRQPRVAHLAAVGVDLPRPVNLPKLPLHIGEAKTHLPCPLVWQVLDGFLSWGAGDGALGAGV